MGITGRNVWLWVEMGGYGWLQVVTRGTGGYGGHFEIWPWLWCAVLSDLIFVQNHNRCVYILYFYAYHARNHVVFWENLHSWQKFYTTAGRDGHDKYQVCVLFFIVLGCILVGFLLYLVVFWLYFGNNRRRGLSAALTLPLPCFPPPWPTDRVKACTEIGTPTCQNL